MNRTVTEFKKALVFDPEAFPFDWPCAVCGFIWMEHCGLICPKCSICGHHARTHSTDGIVDAAQTRAGVLLIWCHDGWTTYLPQMPDKERTQ